MSDDTRDIVIEVRATLKVVQESLGEHISQSKSDREKIMARLDGHDAIVNKGKGAWWGVGVLGLVAGWIGSHFPGLGHLIK